MSREKGQMFLLRSEFEQINNSNTKRKVPSDSILFPYSGRKTSYFKLS
jgi:hypothetical protein